MSELAADGIPVTVACRVLGLARQPHYRLLDNPVTTAELTEVYRANALFDAHQGHLEYGHRFLVDEARDATQVLARQTVWRICSAIGWFSVFSKKHRCKEIRLGPPVQDDHVGRNFATSAPTSCGWPTSPNIARWKGSCICVLFRVCSPTGSWGLLLTHG